MSDGLFTYMYCICCFGWLLSLNTLLLLISLIFYNLTHIHEVIWTVCAGVYYFLVCLAYLALFVLIVKKSFDHVDKIIALKFTDRETILNDTKAIFKYILLNLVFLTTSISLNSFLDFAIIKIPLVLYVCWTLGFTASLRVNKDLCSKFDSNQIKDYLLIKSVLNTSIFLLIYFFIKFVF